MAKYIDREALLQDISEMVLFSVKGTAEPPTSEMRGANKVIDRVKASPAADVAEVKHGEWDNVRKLPNGKYYAGCSICGAMQKAQHPKVFEQFMKYCYYCGAKMDGKEKDNNV